MPSRNATTIQTHFLQFTKNTGDLGWSSLYYSVIDFADEVWRIALTTFDLNGATDDYQYINVRWKSTGPVAVVAVYFEEGSLEIVSLCSQSFGWTTTIKQLPQGRNITMVAVGITNVKNMKIRGIYSLQVDYILISG